ncbi:hypothetical protein FOZ62_019163, partial [Perkinsus olseni]
GIFLGLMSIILLAFLMPAVASAMALRASPEVAAPRWNVTITKSSYTDTCLIKFPELEVTVRKVSDNAPELLEKSEVKAVTKRGHETFAIGLRKKNMIDINYRKWIPPVGDYLGCPFGQMTSDSLDQHDPCFSLYGEIMSLIEDEVSEETCDDVAAHIVNKDRGPGSEHDAGEYWLRQYLIGLKDKWRLGTENSPLFPKPSANLLATFTPNAVDLGSVAAPRWNVTVTKSSYTDTCLIEFPELEVTVRKVSDNAPELLEKSEVKAVTKRGRETFAIGLRDNFAIDIKYTESIPPVGRYMGYPFHQFDSDFLGRHDPCYSLFDAVMIIVKDKVNKETCGRVATFIVNKHRGPASGHDAGWLRQYLIGLKDKWRLGKEAHPFFPS